MPKCVYKMYEEVIFPFIRVCMGNREPFLYSPSHVILSHNVLPNHCCCLTSSSLNCLTQASCSLCWKLCNMALMHSKSYKSEVSKDDHHYPPHPHHQNLGHNDIRKRLPLLILVVVDVQRHTSTHGILSGGL